MYVVMYHYVRKIKHSRYTGIKGLELDLFEQQILFFLKKGYRFVTLENILNKKNIDSKSVLLTFDDGYLDHFLNVFPILMKYHISGVFSMPGKIIREKKVLDVNKIHFILAEATIDIVKERLFERMDYYRGREFPLLSNQELYDKAAVAERFDDKDTIFVKRMLQVELPERLRFLITDELFKEFVTQDEDAFVDELYMNMNQINLMKSAGMEFAIHGYDHYWMNRLTEIELCNDINAALNVFDGIVPNKNWCFCYPYGSCNDTVIATAKENGCTSGLSTEVAIYLPDSMDVFRIPRLDTNDFPPKSENYISM
ncbi:MAG: polysaccharide deacetylase family protein [Butyrivibrio sp.]|nr:polysaccharide deacetylase family protein [Butyrivibrio sp.]